MKCNCSRNQWKTYAFIGIVLYTLLSDMNIVVYLGVWFRSHSIYRREYDISVGVARRIKDQLNSLGDAEADLIKDINYVNILCKGPPAQISTDVDVYKSSTGDLCYVRKLDLDNTDDYS